MDIYPIRWMSWLAAAFCLGFGVAVVVLLLVAHLSLYERILFLGAAAVIPFTARELLRELRHPKPSLRLDHGGLEGSFGRIPWHNVERISIGTRWDWAGYFQPKVILHLHHRARLLHEPDMSGPPTGSTAEAVCAAMKYSSNCGVARSA